MRVAIIIPARYASSRLPAKPLLRETGKYLIQHVYERAVEARCASEVIVATDDERIFDAVRGFGGRVVMTRDHTSGTDRIAEVASHLDATLSSTSRATSRRLTRPHFGSSQRCSTRTPLAHSHAAVPITDRDTYLARECCRRRLRRSRASA